MGAPFVPSPRVSSRSPSTSRRRGKTSVSRQPRTALKPVDLVIIGGGWTGLTMAKELTARTPLSILVLERGGMPGATQYAYGMDEIDYSVRFKMMQNTAEETVTHRH